MPAAIAMILKVFGWKKLIQYAWKIAKPQLEQAAKKTETQFDDDVVKVADEMLSLMLNDKAVQ